MSTEFWSEPILCVTCIALGGCGNWAVIPQRFWVGRSPWFLRDLCVPVLHCVVVALYVS